MPGMLTALVQSESNHKRTKGDRTTQETIPKQNGRIPKQIQTQWVCILFEANFLSGNAQLVVWIGGLDWWLDLNLWFFVEGPRNHQKTNPSHQEGEADFWDTNLASRVFF